jgi:hypothetical protein
MRATIGLLLAIISATIVPGAAFGFFQSEGSKLTASYNEFAASRGFHSAMFLSETERSPKGTSFTYGLNDCVGALGMADDGKDLNALSIISGGCKNEENQVALVHLLLFVADQCSPSEKRPNAERMMLAAFKTISKNTPDQTLELDSCKISMKLSVVGFLINVQ